MTDRWYYWSEADVRGPFSAKQLADLAAAGQILPTDTVWKDGVERGVPACRVQHLFPVALLSPSGESDAPLGGAVVPAPVSPPGAPAESSRGVEPVGPDLSPRWDSAYHPPTGRARAVAGKGAVIVGQDGTTVKFRKKCTECGHEDSSWKTMPITRGTTRVAFFCPKCHKQRHVEVHGHTS